MPSIVDNYTILAVEDVDIACEYFIERMGFSELLRTGGWSFLERGTLKLRVGHCPGIVPISQCQDHSLIIQANVDDANALYEEFRRNKADVSEPEDKPWGFREFGVVTPDGHRFMFVQRLEEREPAPGI